MKTPAAHQPIRQTVLRMTGRAWLAIIPSLVLAAVASMAAPATERNLSRRIGFEANRGQVDAQVQFVARGPAYTAFLTSTEAVLTLGDRHGGHAVLRMERIGANAGAQAAGSGVLPGVVSYFPDGHVDSPVSAPAYRRVRYDDVYPGIDLVYYSRARSLEYVGSSRVDLQACKLEYSIVSPK